jgi:hypothetical protein
MALGQLSFLFSLLSSSLPSFLVGLEFERRALHLQRRWFTARTTPSVHFTLVILEMGGGLMNYLPEAGFEP